MHWYRSGEFGVFLREQRAAGLLLLAMNMTTEKGRFALRFRFVSLLTVVSIYLLILVGGVVRSTGSGMGCPDWPKCFGQWVPPTEASQLPANYKEIYTAQRVAKNQKLARTLQRLGFAQVAGSIFAHPTQYIETDFNAVKTWIEYLNRLLGALIGVFVLLTVVFAAPYLRRDAPVFWLALASFVLTGVQGYLGSLVVSTNLLPVMVTIHMGLALLIVALLLYAVHRAGILWQNESGQTEAIKSAEVLPPAETGGLWAVLWLALLATFGQIVLGTQVREAVDMVAAAANYAGRETWISQLGATFTLHRAASVAVLVLVGYTSYELARVGGRGVRALAGAAVALVLAEAAAGIGLAYWGLPALLQPVHLTLATVLFGVQFLMILGLRRPVVVPLQAIPKQVNA